MFILRFSFYPWLKFYFPLFLGMVMCDNEFKTKAKKFKPRIKLNHNINLSLTSGMSFKKCLHINCCKLDRRLSLSLL